MKYLMVVLVLVSCAAARAEFNLRDGDRVVFIGNTFIERDIQHNYLETLLTIRYPGRNIIFRNLGWSGDTVFVPARAGSAPNKGFDLLLEAVKELRPTVLFIAYGMNESFEGEAGLSRFVDGYNKLLDALKPMGARLVLIGPIPHEDLGRPLPDPAEHNTQLKMYSEAIGKIADERRAVFVDLFTRIERFKEKLRAPITDDGIHLNALGYWLTARMIEQELGLDTGAWALQLDEKGNISAGKGMEVHESKATDRGFEFTGTNSYLTSPQIPNVMELLKVETIRPGIVGVDTLTALAAISKHKQLAIMGLPGEERFRLKADGKALSDTQTGDNWAEGVTLVQGADLGQVEQLRKVIGEKNVMFFDRYRPQNDMYIFHGRKHEQGRNAVEIPQFDKFIAEKEAEIARLRVPVKHVYTLEKVAGRGR